MSQEAVHFEMIDYSQTQQKRKKNETNQMYNKLKGSNVTMEFTSRKDMTTVIKQNHFWIKKEKQK